MGHSKTQSPDHPAWTAFSTRHARSLMLAHEDLYALNEELIGSIVQNVPGFFSDDEVRFERDLCRTVSLGFCARRPHGLQPKRKVKDAEVRRHKRRSIAIDSILKQELQRAGADLKEIGTFFQANIDVRKRVAERQDAYAGWLILNPEYRTEVDQLRTRWGKVARTVGRFPRLPMAWLTDPSEEASFPRQFLGKCMQFLSRWGLDTLATWDWPIPMEPDFGIGQRRDMNLLASGGLFFFVPWYLLRGEKVDFNELFQQHRLAAPEHLLKWANKRTSRNGADLGDISYANIRWLYRFDELVLARRYATACKGNRHRLDQAFAAVIERDEDSVKKLRLELTRALKRRTSKLPD